MTHTGFIFSIFFNVIGTCLSLYILYCFVRFQWKLKFFLPLFFLFLFALGFSITLLFAKDDQHIQFFLNAHFELNQFTIDTLGYSCLFALLIMIMLLLFIFQ